MRRKKNREDLPDEAERKGIKTFDFIYIDFLGHLIENLLEVLVLKRLPCLWGGISVFDLDFILKDLDLRPFIRNCSFLEDKILCNYSEVEI